MSQSMDTPTARFAAIVSALCDQPGVTPPADGPQAKQSFGANGLKIHNKIFAMLVGERLVVKLPKQRIDDLLADGQGERFDPRRDGRLMREWFVLSPTSDEDWLALAREALAFVGEASTGESSAAPFAGPRRGASEP